MGTCCSDWLKSAEDKQVESLVDVHLAFFKKAETFFSDNPGEQWIPIAVTQYALFLQQRADSQHNEPPPFAVAWIWHLHLLHPVAYKSYCESKFLRVISPVPGDMLSGSLEISGTAEAQPDIPLPTTHTGTVATWEQLHSKQLAFFTKTKTFAPTRKQVTRLITKFKKFLQLMKLSTGVLVPTIEIDYIWHSCLRNPLFYYDLCRIHAGKLIDHNDLLDDGFLQTAFIDTKSLYEKTYSDHYEACTWGVAVPILWMSCAGGSTCGGGCGAQNCGGLASGGGLGGVEGGAIDGGIVAVEAGGAEVGGCGGGGCGGGGCGGGGCGGGD
jgi:hypothetical protein